MHELDLVLRASGLGDHIKKNCVKLLAENREIIASNENKPSMDELLFYSMLKTTRDICIDDFNWFMRCISNPRRTFPFHEVEEQFFKYGPSALPPSYKSAVQYGAIFQWHEDPTIRLSLYPRGFGKSTRRGNGEPLWNFVKNPHHRSLILHGDKDKVNTLLGGIALMMASPACGVLWPEFFNMEPAFYKEVGTKILKEKINIKINPEYTKDDDRLLFGTGEGLRREATFTTGSPEVDRTGLHFDIGFFDDLVDKKNSRNRKSQQELCEYLDSLFGMEEYRPEEGDEHHMPLHGVGTRWRGPGLYSYIIEKHRSTVFQLPLTWDEIPSISYSYHRERIAPFVTDKFIERKRAELRDWFESQMYMIERSFDNEISLEIANDIVFCFSDEEDAPDTIPRVKFSRDRLIRSGCTIVAKDPSYSEEGKDGKNLEKGVSLDTTIGAAVKNSVGYIIDEFQQKGGAETTLYAPFEQMVMALKADYFIMDRVGPQRILADKFESLIENRATWGIMQLRLPKDVSRMSKPDRAMMVLSELFKLKSIRIHWRCTRTLNELRRVTQGFDIIDCLVQIFAFSMDTYSIVAEQKEQAILLEKEKSPNIIGAGREVIFKTTGY